MIRWVIERGTQIAMIISGICVLTRAALHILKEGL